MGVMSRHGLHQVVQKVIRGGADLDAAANEAPVVETGCCTECGGKIRNGGRYVCIARHIEREAPRGVVTVEEAEVLATYHEQCAPQWQAVEQRAEQAEAHCDRLRVALESLEIELYEGTRDAAVAIIGKALAESSLPSGVPVPGPAGGTQTPPPQIAQARWSTAEEIAEAIEGELALTNREMTALAALDGGDTDLSVRIGQIFRQYAARLARQIGAEARSALAEGGAE